MHTEKWDRTYPIIFFAMICLFLGVTSSPTLVGGYHIFSFIPTLLIIKKSGMSFKWRKSSWALVILFAWGTIATLANIETLIRPNKSFQDLKYYFFAIFCIPLLIHYFKHAPRKHIKFLLNCLLTAIVVGFFVGVLRSKFQFDPVKMQFVGDKYHVRVGGFTNYMRYGYSSALMLVLGIGAWINFAQVKEYVSKYWLTLFCTFNTLAIILSETRGAVLSLLAGVSFLLLKYWPRIGKTLVALGVVSVVAIGIFSFTKQSTNRYVNINDGSNKIRLSQFYAAIKSIQEKPLFGLGADQFSYHARKIKQKYGIWSQDYSGHTHNIFLEHAANYGLPGLLAFMAFLILWFFEMLKMKSDFSWVLASYVVAFVVGGQVELLFDVINSHLIFFLYSFGHREVLLS